MSNRLHSAERLKSRKEIGLLFAGGARSQAAYPVRCVYRIAEEQRGPHPVQVTFVVPKKRFKRAVDRNLLKRRMREAYRLHKSSWVPNKSGRVQADAREAQGQLALLFMYTGKEILPFAKIERSVVKLLSRLPSVAQLRSSADYS